MYGTLVVLAVLGLFVYNKFVKPRYGRRLDVKQLGEWAVVTGATDGIGKAFAKELASKGLNLLLISRNMEKLEATCREINESYQVITKGVQAEFTLLDAKMYAYIKSEIEKLDVGVLVNNVGMAYVHPEYLHELDAHQDHIPEAILNCNAMSAVKMCQYTLPGMVKRGRGLIINISSGFSIIPSPFISLYGGTKAFLSKFSRSLDLEYRKSGVKVHTLNTGMVATKLLRTRQTSWMLPSPDTYAKSAIDDALNLEVSESTGYIAHTFLQCIVSIMCWLFPDYTHRKLVSVGIDKKDLLKQRCPYCSGSKNRQNVTVIE
ncbi:short chain dehydrogenase [Nesidiocoris tenuis]|uniref:Short chain dehydrogenase n=1 Tax=Nesidiocoris tenuis TaxID=355587 RepID=A0ABN7ALT7_9HEMI|nr:short chain dehydrogenase [Nesidiocoris tenuis]